MEYSSMLALLLLLMSTCDCQNHMFYIRPSDSSHCPQEVSASQCYDLTTLVSEGHLSMIPKINAFLLFLPGEHFLEQDLNVKNTKEFQMTYCYGNSSANSVKIVCTGYSNYGGHSIRVQNVSVVKFNSISFQTCGVELMSVDHSEITDCKWNESRRSAIFIQDSNSIISDCQFMNGICSDCSGGGIFAVHSNVNFTGNNTATNNSVELQDGGGLFFKDSNIHIDGNLTMDSNMAHGNFTNINILRMNLTARDRVNSMSNGGGMYVENCMFVTTYTSFLLFENNNADVGGGVAIFASRSTFNGHTKFSGNSAIFGGGMAVRFNFLILFRGFQAEFSESNYAINSAGAVQYDHHNIFNGNVEFHSNSADYYGGGMLMWDYSHNTFNGHVTFSGNSANYGGGGGIIIWAYSNNTFNEHVTFSGNNAGYAGGGIQVSYNSQNIFNKHAEIVNNSATYGGGVRVKFVSHCVFNSTALLSGNNAWNSGGSLLAQEESNVTFLSAVNVSTSRAGFEGGGIFIRDDSLLVMSGETVVEDNSASTYGGAISLYFSEFRMRGHSNLFNNSAQYGGAIQAISSKIHIAGYHCFEKNRAEFGGGVALSGGSFLRFLWFYATSSEDLVDYFYSNFHLHFISNYAEEYGGAIWVEESPYYSCTNSMMIDSTNRCFINYEFEFGGFVDDGFHEFPETPQISAINNTAISGSILYGGNLDNCVSVYESLHFKSTFPTDNEPIHSSLISSDPKQVCLCSTFSEPDCSVSNYHIQVFSGQQFALTLVGVGQRNGTVPAIVLSHTNPLMSSSDGSETQSIPGSCSEVFYTVTSDEPLVKLILRPESFCREDSLSMLTVTVMMNPCPPGFMLHNETKSCTCDDALRKLDENIQCDINYQSFSHQHGVWIGYDQWNDLNETVIYHPHCPFDYCTQELSTFTLNSTDLQCRYNRRGLICGACRENYSLTLGGSKCTECSNMYLVLFIPLALAGVVLVLFLLTFKLTVSTGTISGLVFFANIIGTNSSVFLPPESTVVLRVFIAWLNLDLGIDTCLADGLDMYTKVWIQFVFPFYIFILIGIIIFLSHRSSLVTKCLGSDPVAVLATLILVAYTKLLRAVLIVMSFTYIRGFGGSSIAVWLYDGNVRYLSGKHIPLFVFSLLIILLLIIPYTVILLFAPYLQRYSRNRVFFLINDHRFKPFLLSYHSPLKDKYRSWVGVLLVLRLCLLIVFAFNSLGDPSINLYAIILVVGLITYCRLVVYGTVYTSWCLDALEIFFLMKLCLFSVSTLFVLHTSGNQRALSDTLVGIIFIVFLAITVYHGWKQLTASRWWRLKIKPKWQKYFNEEDVVFQEDSKPEQEYPQVPTTVIELAPLQQVSTTSDSVKFRESVLELS